MPRAALADKNSDKIEILDDIYKTYLLKDIRSYVRNEDFVAFNKMLRILSSQIGNMINIHKLSDTLNLSYNRCEEYMDILQQMYIIKLLPPYVSNKRKEITKMKKIRSLTSFCEREQLSRSFIVNRNLSHNSNGMNYIPGSLLGLLDLSG